MILITSIAIIGDTDTALAIPRCSRCCSRCFSYSNSLNPHNYASHGDAVVLILQRKKTEAQCSE